LRLAAVERVRRGGRALRRRALRRRAGDAVPGAVSGGLGARRPRGEEVVGVGEVPEAGKRADAGRHRALEAVACDVELLDSSHVHDGSRELPLQVVVADVEDGELPEQADLRRDASRELVVDEHDLVERVGHPSDAGRDATAEAVVSEHDDGGRRVAEVGRDRVAEAVGVEEDGVERAVEERRRDAALEVVEAEVEVPERRQRQHHLREPAHEAVVADVKLVEEVEVREGVWDDAAEAVGVDVEECEVGDAQRQRRGKVPGDVGVVEVDPGDDDVAGVGAREWRAEDAVVGADVGPHPVGGEVGRVGEDGGALPRLQRGVGRAEASVRERPRRRRVEAGRQRRRVRLGDGVPAALLRRRRRGREQQQQQRESRRAAEDHGSEEWSVWWWSARCDPAGGAGRECERDGGGSRVI